MANKVTPFLMFPEKLEEALAFYVATFPDSKILQTSPPRSAGALVSAELVVGGQHLMAYQGGPYFQFSEAISLHVHCEDQQEVDLYWERILKAGGKETQCGWIKDPFGVSWQIVPRRFTELVADPDPKKVQAVVAAMLKMKKLDVAALEQAYASA